MSRHSRREAPPQPGPKALLHARDASQSPVEGGGTTFWIVLSPHERAWSCQIASRRAVSLTWQCEVSIELSQVLRIAFVRLSRCAFVASDARFNVVWIDERWLGFPAWIDLARAGLGFPRQARRIFQSIELRGSGFAGSAESSASAAAARLGQCDGPIDVARHFRICVLRSLDAPPTSRAPLNPPPESPPPPPLVHCPPPEFPAGTRG